MTGEINYRDFIRDIPDFPEPGILFRDITPLLREPRAFGQALDAMTEWVVSRRPECIVAVESRGFFFGAPLAARLALPFVPVRKPGKLPAERMSVEYALEYGTGQLDIHVDSIPAGQRALIVDDLVATGGTAAGTAELVQKVGGTVAGIAVAIELLELNGRARLSGYDFFALVGL
jgi:adenine phosphoribosyltransferase